MALFSGKHEAEQKRRRPVISGNRTQANSYYQGEQRKDRTSPMSPHEKKKNSPIRLRLLPTFLAVAVITGALLFNMTLAHYPGLVLSGEVPALYRPPEAYQQAAQQLLKESWQGSTKLTVNTVKVEAELRRMFPEIAGVRLSLPVLGRRPNVHLKLRTPALIITNGSRAYVMDSMGRVIAEAAQVANEYKQQLAIVEDKSGLAIRVGGQVVTSETVAFITEVKAQLADKQLAVNQLVLPPFANELDIYLQDMGYFVKCDLSGSAREQIGAYLAVREHLASRGETPQEYIDVRVEEKAFYK